MTNISICNTVAGYRGRPVDGERVAVRGRDENGIRTVDYYTQYASFFINPATFRLLKGGRGREVNEYDDVMDLLENHDSIVSYHSESQSSDKTPLIRVNCHSRTHVRYFLNNYGPVYGADLDQQDAVVIDNKLSLPDSDIHIGYFDIEALQFKSDDADKLQWLTNVEKPIWQDNQMVNSIVFYSSFMKEYTAFACHPNFERINKTHEWGREHRFKTEYDMLTMFADWLYAMDFDLVTGWNSAGYDLTVLYHRMESLGVPHPMNYMAGKCDNGLFPEPVYGGGAMSPYGIMDSPYFMGGREYRWTDQPIRGIDTLDLMVAFKRIYKDSTNNELPGGNSLERVARAVFGRGKQPSPDFYSKDYDKTWEEFLEYNIRDVELLVEIDEAYNVVNSYKVIQNLVGCQFKSTFYATYLARVMFTKEADWQQVTPRYQEDEADKDEDDDLQGAIVMNPKPEPEEREPDDYDVYCDSVGLHDWTVILDFAGLYPSIMCAYNTCHSTKVLPGMPHLEDDMIGHKGVRFRKNPIGVLPRMVLQLDEQRDEYKARLKEAEAAGDKKAAMKWNTMQLGVKRLRASFYGILAFEKFSWHDKDLAATITMGGRNALLSIKKEAEKQGYKVVFGHTDSIFVTFPSEWSKEQVFDESTRLAKDLTDLVQSELRTDKVVVELEAIMDRYFIAKKNRYAGRKVWDDKKGFKVMDYDIETDPWSRIKMSGMEAKHTNTAPVGKNIQIETLKKLFDGVSERLILRSVRRLVKDIVAGKVEQSQLIANAKVGKHLPHHLDWRGLPVECDCGICPKPKTGDDAKDEDACYVSNFWIYNMSAWYNEHISLNDTDNIEKGDSVNWTIVKDGPTAITSNGIVAFREVEEISDYEMDYEMLAQKHVADKMKTIFTAMGWDIRLLDPDFKVLLMSDFSEIEETYVPYG